MTQLREIYTLNCGFSHQQTKNGSLLSPTSNERLASGATRMSPMLQTSNEKDIWRPPTLMSLTNNEFLADEATSMDSTNDEYLAYDSTFMPPINDDLSVAPHWCQTNKKWLADGAFWFWQITNSVLMAPMLMSLTNNEWLANGPTLLSPTITNGFSLMSPTNNNELLAGGTSMVWTDLKMLTNQQFFSEKSIWLASDCILAFYDTK